MQLQTHSLGVRLPVTRRQSQGTPQPAHTQAPSSFIQASREHPFFPEAHSLGVALGGSRQKGAAWVSSNISSRPGPWEPGGVASWFAEFSQGLRNESKVGRCLVRVVGVPVTRKQQVRVTTWAIQEGWASSFFSSSLFKCHATRNCSSAQPPP